MKKFYFSGFWSYECEAETREEAEEIFDEAPIELIRLDWDYSIEEEEIND